MTGILCLGGPRDTDRYPDFGPVMEVAELTERFTYRKVTVHCNGQKRLFYIPSGVSEEGAANYVFERLIQLADTVHQMREEDDNDPNLSRMRRRRL